MQTDFLRYSCQMVLPGFSEEIQQKLQDAKVLIAGAGGLGCPAAQYLAALGVGTIGIADFDTVSISNLHRQILYTPAEVGLKKVMVASTKLQQQNPFIKIIPLDIKITSDNVVNIIKQYDIVIDATDNFDAKYLLNDACVLEDKPLVYGAIYQYEGQVAVWNILNQDGTRSPNYRDIFPDANATQIPDCAEGGVLPTLAGIIGCMQANEVVKYITNTGEILAGNLLILDAKTLQSTIIKIGRVTKTCINNLSLSINIPGISAEDLKKGLNENMYELVDVRSNEEREIFNIGGKHFPLDEINKKKMFEDAEKPVVFYCATGKRSDEAVRLIKKTNPNANIFSLAGGIKTWIEKDDQG